MKSRIWQLVLAVLTIATLIVSPNPGRAAAQADLLSFLPLTVEGPFEDLGPHPAWLGVSGDWVAYATDIQSCGHCSRPIINIYLRNIVDGRKVAIKTGYLTP